MNELYSDGWFGCEPIPGVDGLAAFTSHSKNIFREQQDISPMRISDSLEIMPWGADNMMPFDVIDYIERDETVTACQQFNAEICYGSGLTYNADNASGAIRGEVERFFLENSMPSYFLGVCHDFKHFHFCVTVIILNANRDRIVNIIRKEAAYCRFTPADKDGRIRKIVYANWRNSVVSDKDCEVIELLDFDAPLRDLEVRLGLLPDENGVRQRRSDACKFAVVTRIPSVDSFYYPIPYYAALFRGKWYNIKQLIGIAKEAKLKNTAPLKYHISISERYWEKVCKREGITDRTKQKERVIRGKHEILDFLSGAENSGRALFSEYYVNPKGEVQQDVIITKIDSAKEGGDWQSDIQEAVNMICFAMRVHSNLVGSVPGKAQSNNSGSDKRELYTIAHALQKPYHDLLFMPHKLIIAFNGWDGVKPECPFVMLTTLDEKKDAKKVSFNTEKGDSDDE